MPVYWLMASKGLTFIKKMKMMNFCIFDGFLNCCGCFFCGKLTKHYRHARTFQLVSQLTGQPVAMPELSNWSVSQLVSQQSLASINNKNPKILTKRPPVATTVPSGTQRHHVGIGILGYTFGSSIQARTIPPPSWGSALPVPTGSL